MKKRLLALLGALLLFLGVLGCVSDADRASQNLSIAAEQFEINRRIVFYNGITDRYILSIEGKCSVEFYPEKFTVTCKVGKDKYKKHYLGRADNVFPFVEQLEPAKADVFHYRVVLKPQNILPNIDIHTSGDLEKE